MGFNSGFKGLNKLVWNFISSTENTKCLHKKCAPSNWKLTQMRCTDFISTSVDKQNLKTFLPNYPSCNYFPPLQLDVTNVIKATKKERVCSVFGEEWNKISRATCIFHTIIHNTTTECWFLRTALEGSTKTFQICTRQKKKVPESLFWKCLVSAGMLCTVCKWKLVCVGQFIVVC